MSLKDFYSGKTLLITGATGFLGKVVLEKICRSLPSIKTIYISVQPKGFDSGVNSEYQRFKQEILDSQIFDRLKLELGLKPLNKLIADKLVPIPMDLMHPTLNLSKKLRTEITQNLNIIINSAANVDLSAGLDISVRLNVSGPLQLLKLARESPGMEVFLQVSTVFVNGDRTGYVEEQMYSTSGSAGNQNWQTEYDRILTMSKHAMDTAGASILKGFPDAYTYSKRMAEELLDRENRSGGNLPPIPMVFLRPSIVAAAESEPMPGWTDTQGLLSGMTLAVGLGVMKDTPGNPDSTFDAIPVDYVARQLLVSIAFAKSQALNSQGRESLFILQSATSGANPITAMKFFKDMITYMNNFPYEKRAGVAQLTMHRDPVAYERAFRYRSQLPTKALFYITRVLSTRKFRADVRELQEGVEQVRQANKMFQFYLSNEWVFDNANAMKLENFLHQSSDQTDVHTFNVNVKNINWKHLAMNHAYGVKHYVLKEEAALPSIGYNDSLVRIGKFNLGDMVPWTKRVNWNMQVRNIREMQQMILETDSVKESIGAIVADKLAYYKNTLQLDVDENKIYQEVRDDARKSLNVIMANYQPNALRVMAQAHVYLFKRIYDKIVVNEIQLDRIRKMQIARKGPIVFCPTHRSYVDFLILSVVLLFYKIDVPHICAGEDLMHITGVSAFLRMCGAFFMRRTFRGDPMYKAIFTEYVTQLVKDRTVMEFFVEGTRSRTNKMLSPKFGILKIMADAFFDRKVEELTFVPVNINYTRTLEDGSFPGELTGTPKVKENLGRLVGAIDTLSINYGSLYLDFHDPINVTEDLRAVAATRPEGFDPYSKRADRLFYINELGYKLVFQLQKNTKIMPTTLVATIILLYRKGISEETLLRQVNWLGMALVTRGAKLSDAGLPDETTLRLGLKQLDEFILKKRDVLMPKVIYGADQNVDNSSYIMLNYYRNPLQHFFFHESLIVCSMLSFGVDNVWKSGVNVDELFMRTCYLSNMLKREEQQEKEITQKTREVFEARLEFMSQQRLMYLQKDSEGHMRVHPKSAGEATIILLGSLVWPLVDTYYIVTLFALSLVKRKDVEDAKFSRDVQWVAETMYQDGKLNYFESCNQVVINNAKAQLLQMKVLAKKSIYINLAAEYQKAEGEILLEKLIETVGSYRNLPMAQRRDLEEFNPDGELRRKVFSDFPIMAKL